MSDICNCTSIGELLTNYDDTQVRSDIQQLNTDINTQTGRINTALSDLETAKTTKIAEMDAAKVAAETATAAAIVATQNADAATQATQTAIAQAERLNVELEGSVITVTDKDGNESEIDLLDATNERVYINITTDVAGVSVEGLTINAYYNNAEQPSATATTDAQGKCYLDVPNNYRYRLVFPTIAGCDPITDVTHIAHASERIIDVEYKEIPTPVETGERLVCVLQEKDRNNYIKLANKQIIITYDGVSTTYLTDENGQLILKIPFGKEYTVEIPRIENYYIRGGKYVLTYISNSASRVILYNYIPFNSGVFIVDIHGDEYRYDEWSDALDALETQGEKDAKNSEAILVKVATSLLMELGTCVGIEIDRIANQTWGSKNIWSSIETTFPSIPADGRISTSQYYYDGQTATKAIITDSIELHCTVPLFTNAQNYSVEIGGISLNGFIGSVGQWQSIMAVSSIVEDMVELTRPESVIDGVRKTITVDRKWCSAQCKPDAYYYYGVQFTNNIAYHIKNGTGSQATKNGYGIPLFAV